MSARARARKWIRCWSPPLRRSISAGRPRRHDRVPGSGSGGYTSPVTEYGRGTGPYQGATVIGGYVYGGPIASLQNYYVFGDYISGNLWAVPQAASCSLAAR